MIADNPLVSVIVPAWNAEATLEETLSSAARQTYGNVEIIIVDDGSTDSTARLAGSFCASYPRARLVQQNNRGLSAARNRAVAESAGEWIAPLDADDLWHPTKIEKQVTAALAAPARPGFVYCWYQHIDEQGYVLGSGPRWSFEGAALKRFAYLNTIHTMLLAREAVERVGGYDTSLRACEDAMIQLRIARHFPIAVVQEYLLGYRKRAGSMSRDTQLVLNSWRSVHATLVAEGAGIPPDVLRWTEAFFKRAAAEEHLTRSEFASGFSSLAKALWLDPLRWGPDILYRIARTAVRLARGRRTRPHVHFDDVDPNSRVPVDPDELSMLAALVRRLDEGRLRRLQRAETLEPIPAVRLDRSRLG